MASFEEVDSLLESPQSSHEKEEINGPDETVDVEQQRNITQHSNLLRLLHIIYTITVTFLMVVVLAQNTIRSQSQIGRKTTSEPGDHFRSLPLKPVVWRPDPNFADPDTFRALMNRSIKDVGWDTLRLKDGYWLELPINSSKKSQRGLPPQFFNSTSTTTEAFVPSFHHQLHCLMQLKIVVTGLETPYVSPEHASHCIELIRQALMCSADLSFESPSTVNEEYWVGPSGWDGTHLCKDWDAIDKIVSQYGIPQAALLANAAWLTSG